MGLLEHLKTALGESGEAGRDTEQARRIAAAVLMLAMAHADNEHRAVEYDEIKAQLQHHFSLTAAEAQELIDAARSQSRTTYSLHPWLKTLNDGMAIDDKRQVLEMLWRVAYADNRLDPQEEHLMRELSELLFLSHADFIRAKLAVTGDAPD